MKQIRDTTAGYYYYYLQICHFDAKVREKDLYRIKKKRKKSKLQ